MLLLSWSVLSLSLLFLFFINLLYYIFIENLWFTFKWQLLSYFVKLNSTIYFYNLFKDHFYFCVKLLSIFWFISRQTWTAGNQMIFSRGVIWLICCLFQPRKVLLDQLSVVLASDDSLPESFILVNANEWQGQVSNSTGILLKYENLCNIFLSLIPIHVSQSEEQHHRPI